MFENVGHSQSSASRSGPAANGSAKVKLIRSSETVNSHSKENMVSRNQGMASSNTTNWEPDVQMLLSTAQWLKIHGLKRHKLDLGQILPSIGFRHSDDYVRPLKKPVRARYCKGLFTQVPYRDGTVFNLTTKKEKLQAIETQLQQAIALYKKRLEWLTTESRRVFGVIEERCVCIVLDVEAASGPQFDVYLHALIQVLKEQAVFLAKFNLIRATLDMDCWQEEAVCVTLASLEGALDWLWKLKRNEARSSTCTVEAIAKALQDEHVEAVYLFTEGDASVEAQELLRRKVQDCRVPLHVVSFNCTTPSTITFLKSLCKTTKGRFHAFSVTDEYEDAFDSFKKSMETDSSAQPRGRGRGDGMPSVKLGVGLRADVISLWEELDEARNTLAEIQALQCEMREPKGAAGSTGPAAERPSEVKKEGGKRGRSELYMSSRDWLKRHGLRSKKLGFYDLLQTLAFKHCDGVVDIQSAPAANGGSDAIVRPKLVNARYCDKFAHVRWKDGSIMHVHVSGPVHRNFEQRMLSALDSYRKRMEWLQQGSRELFGTIIEDQAAILIDTSASMATRLFLVKDKLYRLMQEQLRHKVKFNLLKFDSRVQAWRDRMVDCNTHNLDNAWQWVKGLSTGGSTNTLSALKLALSDPQCQAIYLLTDGRPDQPPSSILAQVHLLNPVPMHTISFNCADTEANQFLCQLAAETGGRFHYFSEDGYDVDGPKPFESEDLRLLREEIDRGLADLKKVAMIRNECAQLDWYGSNAGRCSKSHPRSVSQPQRPLSACAARAVPSPPSTTRQRPYSARTRAHSARPRPSSARLTHSSYKDYLVSSASREIEDSGLSTRTAPPPQARETKASLLRLNMNKSQSSEWILPESREYLARKPQDYKKKTNGSGKKKKATKKKKPKAGDDDDLDLPVKTWLKKNGLVARKLTILDALAPTMIRHTTKYVPILDKHVLSKVFDQVLPLAHTSGSNREEVQLVNPQGVNLKAYENKLQSAIEEYTRHLDELVFVCLSDDERVKYPEDKLPSFLKNKESMLSDLEKQGWPLPEEDIALLEKEIEQAQVFLSQSEDLRKTSEQAAREIAEQQRKAREEAENKRLEQIMKKNDKKDSSPPAPLPGNKYRLRHHKVLARSEVDGFYYSGLVSRCLNTRYVEVDFNDFDRQVVPVRFVIPVEGARPCPSLKVGDYVLVKTLVPREDEDDLIEDTVHCYVPGIVQVVPLRKATPTKCFTVLRFNGRKITSLRGDLIKISKARYTFACRYIRDALLSAYRSTSPFGFYPRNTREETNLKNEEDDDDDKHDSASSRSSRSSRGRGSSGKRSPSPAQSNHKSSRSSSGERSPSPARSGSKSPRSSSGERSPSPAQSARSGGLSSMKEKLEELKNELEAKHLSQLRELREQFRAEREAQQTQQEELERRERELREKQQELLQGQLDEQKARAGGLQEEQRRLQQQQEDLLTKQRDQQEQLLQHQFNQTQSLQLQHQQLLQQLAHSGKVERAVSPALSSPSSSPCSSRQSSPSVSPRSPKLSPRSPKLSPKGSSEGSRKGSSRGSPKRSQKGSEVSPKGSPKGSVGPDGPRPDSARSSKKSSRKSSRPSSRKAASDKGKDDKGKHDSSDSDSPSVSSSSSSSSSDEAEVVLDETDGPVGAEPGELGPDEAEPPNLQFHLSGPGNEACLLTKGSHGLLISRLPPDQDPAVETRPVPKKVEVGEEVLARWSDDGWYYRGTVRKDCGDGSYFIEDSLGDLEQIYRPDIITDADDADNVISRDDAVVGLHPSFPFSYAPGVIMDVEEENLFHLRHYDGMESLVPRDEVYLLPADKFETDCQYILNCEQSLVGQAVVARNDEDGLFHLGKVRERVGNGRQYIIEWAEQSLQLQSRNYIFGAHTKRHPLVIGDRVLALVDPATYVYMPGWITGSNGRRLCIKFCNGKSSSQVDPLQCFRLSRDYYDRIVDHYNKKNKQKR